MKAVTVEPHRRDTARLEDIPEPDPTQGSVLVEAIAVGVCGTDAEIVDGHYGWAPPGRTRLVLGHESLACRPCDRHGPRRCPLKHFRCMRELSVESVAERTRSLFLTPDALV